MPSPASIAARVARDGEPVVLKRTGQADLTVPGFVRGYRADELVDNVRQGDRVVTIAGPALATWPTPSQPAPPKAGDRVAVRGRDAAVISVETRTLRGADAMHILQVRG